MMDLYYSSSFKVEYLYKNRENFSPNNDLT